MTHNVAGQTIWLKQIFGWRNKSENLKNHSTRQILFKAIRIRGDLNNPIVLISNPKKIFLC
jgi:hypothetical protein